jgi:hypothetical protein
MGGFVPGPVIKFSVDEASLVAQVQSVLANVNQQVQAQNKQVSQSIGSQIANPLIVQAAQLRALYSTGSIGLKDLQTQQKALVASLDVQIKQLATRNDLDKQALATLKQLTLERERQSNALNRGVGVTSGTTSALSLVSSPIIANISRLSAGLLGIAGGSGGSGGGASGAAFAGAAASITSVTAAGGPAIAILGALAAAFVAATGAAVGLAISGGALVQNLSNVSQRTGISIQNLQALQAAGGVVGLSLDDLVIGFRKFSQVLTGGGVDENGDFQTATKKSTEILQALGVTSKDSFTAIEQVGTAFQKLPDGPTKAAVAVQLFGRSGLQLIPILNQGAEGVEKFRAIVEQFGPSIDQNAIQSQLNWQLATTKLSLAFDSLKVAAIPVLDVLSKLTESAAYFLSTAVKNPSGTASGIFAGILSGGGNPGATIGAISTNLALLPSPVNKLGTAAVTAGSSLDAMFKIAEAGGSRLKVTLDGILAGNFDEFLKKINENAKEFEQGQIERGNSAQSLITNTLHKLPPGASESDRAVQEMNDEIEKIREAVLGLPGLVESADAAIAKLTADTIAGLAQIEQDSLEKASEAVEKILEEEQNKRIAINNIIKQAQDQAAVDAAAATESAVAKIIAEEQKRFDELQKQIALQGASEQDFANLRVAIEQDANARIAKARQDELDKTNKEVEQQAGQLFDALIRGGGSFTKALKDSLQNLLLSPVKQVFEAVVGAIFTPVVQAAKDGLKNLGDSLKGQGGILGAIGKQLSPPTAIGTNTQQVSLNTTATQDNTAALNNLNGILTGTAPSGSGGSISGRASSGASSGLGQVLFGGAGGAGGLIFHGLPGGSGGNNGSQSSGAGAALNGLQKVPGAIAGAGLLISGLAQGGIGGALSDALGGLTIGATFGGPVGAAIGAAAGFGLGLIRTLFGGKKGPTQAQIQAAIKKQYIDPNTFVGQEFDRSAQRTFGATLASNFSTGPGGTFGNASINPLPPPPAPVPMQVTIQTMDSKGVAEFVNQYKGVFAKAVSTSVNTTQTGLARSIKAIVSPA